MTDIEFIILVVGGILFVGIATARIYEIWQSSR